MKFLYILPKSTFGKFIYVMKYLFYHRWFVFIECCKRGIILRGVFHDIPKFTPFEFYVNVCLLEEVREIKEKYGYLNLQKASHTLQYGVIRHKNRNDHHWEYWLYYDQYGNLIPIKMKKNAVKEMIADWISASIICGKDLKKWYDKNKNNMLLHPKTREYIEKELFF